MLSLIGPDDVLDNVIGILKVYSEHLHSLSIIFNLFHYFFINYLFQVTNPHILGLIGTICNMILDEVRSNQEVLMNVMHQVLKVSVHTCFGIDGGLLTCKEMVELYNTYGYSFKLLSLDHQLSYLDISY